MNKEMERRVTELEERLRRQDGQRAKKPSIVNINIVDADTEYSHMLPIGCKRFTLHVRDGTAIRLSFTRGVVAKPDPGYWTLKANNSWSEARLDIEADTWLYFACDSTAKVLEIIQWS